MKFLILPALIVLLSSCASNKYEGYSKPLVISSVEYEGRHDSLWCKGEFDCRKGALECVFHYHKEATKYIDRAKTLLKQGKADLAVLIELYNSWCRLQQAKQYIALLKYESPDDFDILIKTGLIRQVKIVSMILSIKIRELENGN